MRCCNITQSESDPTIGVSISKRPRRRKSLGDILGTISKRGTLGRRTRLTDLEVDQQDEPEEVYNEDSFPVLRRCLEITSETPTIAPSIAPATIVEGPFVDMDSFGDCMERMVYGESAHTGALSFPIS